MSAAVPTPTRIDPAVFATWMAVLADKIGRPLQKPTQAVYHEILSRSLSTEQFAAAAQLVLEAAAFNVWPSPGEFVRTVRPDGGDAPSPQQAFEATYTIVGVPRAYGRPWGDLVAEVADRVGPAAARAADALRGVLRRHTDDQLPYLRRDFAREYEAAASLEATAGRLERVLPGEGAQLLARAGFPALHAPGAGALAPSRAPQRLGTGAAP